MVFGLCSSTGKLWREGNHGTEKAYIEVIEWGNVIPVPAGRRTLQLWACGSSGFRVKDIRKGFCIHHPRRRKVTEGMGIVELKLHGSLDRPWPEPVNTMSALPWRSQDVGDSRVLVELPCRLLTESRTSPRERSRLQATRLKEVGDLKSTLTWDTEMKSLKFAQLVFGLL